MSTTPTPTDTVKCPTCEADPGEPCRKPSGRRTGLHKERVADEQVATVSPLATQASIDDALSIAKQRLEEHRPVPNTKVRVLVAALEASRA